MANLSEIVVESLNAYLDAVADINAASSTQTLWYRGASNAGHALKPRLYRSPGDAADLLAVESEMLAQFRSRSGPLLREEVRTDWGFLFIMQHYGVPTRLLDWSENAFLALYFALSIAASKDYPTDAAVWVLDPASWNLQTFPGMDSPGRALHAEDSSLNNFSPKRELNSMSGGAAAMFALYNNPRITAQRGVFTVFGRENLSMEDMLANGSFADQTLTRLRFPQTALSDLNEQIRVLGFRESMIYPDLEGLASEIRTEKGLL
jgi:hypothetical protein